MVISFGEVLMDCFPDKNVIGGAPFNVAVHLKRLGEEACIISKVGEDELGQQIQEILVREGLTAQLQIDKNYPTGRVDVTLENGQPSYYIHQGCGWEFIDSKEIRTPNYFVFGSLALFFEQNKKSFEKYRNQFETATFICDINLRTPYYDKETINLCLNAADIIKINDEELAYLSKAYQVEHVIDWLKTEFSIHKILLTEGAKGATLFWEDKILSCEVKKVENIKDTVGAGDSFTSLFLQGILHHLPLDLTMQRAADFAGSICQTSGAVPADLNVYEKYKF